MSDRPAQLEMIEASYDALQTVYRNLSRISLEEYRDTPSATVFAWWVQEPAHALFVDGEPEMIVGHMPIGRLRRAFWFLCTDKYWRLGVPGVLAARNHLVTIRDKYPDISFEVFSFSRHPDAARWFRTIGFVPNGRVADCETFVLKR